MGDSNDQKTARDRTIKTASSRAARRVTSGGHVRPQAATTGSTAGSTDSRRGKRRKDANDSDPQAASDPDSESDADSASAPANAKVTVKSGPVPLPTQDDVSEFLRNLKSKSTGKCCSKATRHHCCLETHFLIDNSSYQFQNDAVQTVDTTQLYSFITALRTIVRNYNKKELDEHIIAEVRRCITRTTALDRGFAEGSDSAKQFTYNWSLELSAASSAHLRLVGPIFVCREVFVFAWGITDYQLKRTIDAIKLSDYGYVHSSKVQSFTDHSRVFENYSFDEIETICQENLTMPEGKKLSLGTFEIGNVTVI